MNDQSFGTGDDGGLSLTEHLAELRTRLINSLYAIIAGTFLCFSYGEQIFNVIRKPIEPYLPAGGLIYTAPLDKFMAHVKLAFVGGLMLSSPWWLYQVWQFVAPGLYRTEKKYAASFIFSGTLLFASGASFAYFVVLPMAFHFLMTFGGEQDKPMIAIDHYLSFVTQLTVMFGLAFEMPLALVTLAMMEIVSKEFLATKRRYAIMIMAIASAIITPPDLMSMLMMLGPMIFLYEFSIVLVGVVERKRAGRGRE